MLQSGVVALEISSSRNLTVVILSCWELASPSYMTIAKVLIVSIFNLVESHHLRRKLLLHVAEATIIWRIVVVVNRIRLSTIFLLLIYFGRWAFSRSIYICHLHRDSVTISMLLVIATSVVRLTLVSSLVTLHVCTLMLAVVSISILIRCITAR